MIDLIGFDADDTLWHNETLYIQTKRKFQHLFSDYHDAEVIGQELDQTEFRNLQLYGYGIKGFTLSMIETAVKLTNGRVSGDKIQNIIDSAKAMLSADVRLFEHAEETLARLSVSRPLMLITKGDLFDQQVKVKRSGLAKYFKHIEIVSEKTAATYRALLEKQEIEPERFLMVGNSLRSDILPVVSIGGCAVYIPFAETWVHETVIDHTLSADTYFQLDHLGQLPALITSLESKK